MWSDLRGVSLHQRRHSCRASRIFDFATRLRGTGLDVIVRLLGHETPMTQGYAHLEGRTAALLPRAIVDNEGGASGARTLVEPDYQP